MVTLHAHLFPVPFIHQMREILMPRQFTMAAFTITVGLALWTLQGLAADAPKAGAAAFDGKLVLVYFKGRTADHAFTIEKARFEDFHGTKMLSGVHADTGQEPDWMRGRETKIAWDSVESLTLYDNVEDYKEAIAPYGDDAL